ncbi:MAG: hypothetical protein KIH69_017505 [Anaerolineae bacterium]|nr:hypothetical protein [Anaerolineae bacterium]
MKTQPYRIILATLLATSPLVVMSFTPANGDVSPSAIMPSVAQQATTWHVSPNGVDVATCGISAAPCRSIQQAVNLASNNDTILVAEGTYTFNAAVDPCNSVISAKAVVCVLGKQLTINGGYRAGEWGTADPVKHPTILDGQNVQRGVIVRGTSSTVANTHLTMNGVTVQNGLAQGTAGATGIPLLALGGGVLVETATMNLSNALVRNSRALGQANPGDSITGGGGIAFAAAISGTQSVLTKVRIEGSEAQGGPAVSQAGGLARGGGLFVFRSDLKMQTVTLVENKVVGGAVTGLSASTADAFGGGAMFCQSTGQPNQLTANNNQAVGGSATSSDAGAAWGGALFVDAADVTINDAKIGGNQARGGDGVNGGSAHGGAATFANSAVTIERAEMVNNLARSGNANNAVNNSGSAGGGAIFATAIISNAKRSLAINNSIFAANEVLSGVGKTLGGGGGGLWLSNIATTISHATIADNKLPISQMYGAGLLVNSDSGLPSQTQVQLSYNIVASHSNTSSAGIFIAANALTSLHRNMFAGNVKDIDGSTPTVTALNLVTTTAGFVSPGAPNYNYRITTNSPAKDQAAGSPSQIDIDKVARVNPDIGAAEATFTPPSGTSELAVQIAPTSSRLNLTWNAIEGAVKYHVLVNCPFAANPPEQGGCGVPISTTDTKLALTGLSNYALYNLEVLALDGTNKVLSASPTLRAFPTDLSYFLPLIAK